MTGSTRESLVTATIEIIAENGFEGLSVRALATRTGMSAGAVQHHFPTKAAMLEAAMGAITAGAREQYALEDIPDPVERLHTTVDRLMPRDSADTMGRVWLAFAARAAVDEQTRIAYEHLWSRVRWNLRLLIAAASGRPDTAEDDSVELLALLDGLALSIVAEQHPPFAATARTIAHQRVDALIAR